MQQTPIQIQQKRFDGGMVSDLSEPTVVNEQLSHCREIENFFVDTTGTLNKRKGGVFATKVKGGKENAVYAIAESSHIVYSEIIFISNSTINVRYFISNPTTPTYPIVFNFNYADGVFYGDKKDA